jgi:hypothetical protein
MKEYLPIGSVVLLKGGTKRIMICGRVQRQVDNDVIWDYSACLYPEGFIDPNELFLFNNEDIERLYFIGMQDAEEIEFRRMLSENYGDEEEEE